MFHATSPLCIILTRGHALRFSSVPCCVPPANEQGVAGHHVAVVTLVAHQVAARVRSVGQLPAVLDLSRLGTPDVYNSIGNSA